MNEYTVKCVWGGVGGVKGLEVKPYIFRVERSEAILTKCNFQNLTLIGRLAELTHFNASIGKNLV